MLSNKRFGIAREIGIAVAHSHFIWFLNPKHRGPKFKWDDIYHIVDSFSRSHIGLTGNFGRDKKEMEDTSAKAAKHTLDRCFKESNIKESFPD